MIKINLSLKPIRTRREILWIIPIIILLFILCYILYCLQEKRIFSLKKEAKILQAQMERLRVVEDSVITLRSKDDSLKERIAVFHSLDKKWYSPEFVLQGITELCPKGVQIKEISLDPDNAQIKGSAGANRHAAELVRRLKDSELFKDAKLAKLAPSKSEEEVEFIIKAKR